ncbi:MAG: hypothetical protein K8R25_06875 [Methanosarcinales archaeon]|nr:hypothetical protein [Methanosarcinales archaeon]
MRTAIAVILFLMIISTSTALSDHEWDETTCILSYSSPVIIKDGYTLTAVDFDGYGNVHINISRDGEVIDSTSLKNNETNWVTADNGNIKLKGLRITDQKKLSWIGNWPDDPKVEIIIKTKREQTLSCISIEIEIDDEEYIVDETVTVEVIVKNVGEIDANDVHLSVSSSGLYTDDELEYVFNKIEDGASRSKTLKFQFNRILSENLSIYANATWDNEQYNISTSEQIDIEPSVSITKSMTLFGNQTATYFTSIGVVNNQARTVHVILADVLPMGFTLINGSVTDSDINNDNNNNNNLVWEFDIEPDKLICFTYESVTSRPAVYRVPRPHAKCITGEKVEFITSDYSTFVTVHECRPDHEHQRNPVVTPTPTPTATQAVPQIKLGVTIITVLSLIII